MNFKAYLEENLRRRHVELDDIVELLATDYSDALALLECPLFRGSQSYKNIEYAVRNSAAGERVATHGGALYNKILDRNPANAGYPKRLYSTICSTGPRKAADFGPVCVVFPKNGHELAVVPHNDIWGLSFHDHVTGKELDFSNFESYMRHTHNITTFAEVKEHTPWVFDELRYDRLGVELVEPQQLKRTALMTGGNEVWFDGPCLLVRLSNTEDLQRALQERGLA